MIGIRLDIEDLKTGNYIDLLDQDKYFTRSKPTKNTRQRVNVNFLGNEFFCPIVRKNNTLLDLQKIDIKSKLNNITVNYDKSVLRRALTFLYNNKLSLLMKFLLQNNFKLSISKKDKYFSFLTDNEIKKIEDLSISIFNTVNNRT